MKTIKCLCLIAILMSCFIAHSAFAGHRFSVVSTKSTYVHGNYALQGNNYGAQGSFEVCQSDRCIPNVGTAGAPRIPYIAWDLSQFGKTTQISDVNIIFTKMFSQDNSPEPVGPIDLSMEKLAGNWNEGYEVGAPPGDSNECTYNNRPSIVGYEIIQCQDSGAPDANLIVVWESVAIAHWSGNQAVEPPYTQYAFNGASVTNLVQQWITHPEQNFGVALMTHDPNGVYSFLGLFSDDAYGDDAAYKPLLQFTVTGCGEYPYLVSDINKDCHVDFKDIRELVSEWLVCTAPTCF